MKIVVLDGFLVNHDNIGLNIGEHEQIWYPATASHEVVQRIGDADGILVNRQEISRETMMACPTLKFIGTLGTGYNIVDIEAAKELGIIVSNVPSYSTDAVAQAAVALMLDIATNTSRFHAFVKSGGWKKGSAREIVAIPTFELSGKTLGIFGMGNIGGKVAEIAAAIGMNVIAYRRNKLDGDSRFVDMDTLFASSDIISMHCPLTAETQGIINAETIAKMKDGAILINTSRGGLLDEQAVADALDSGKLYALGADVLADEPPLSDSPLALHPRAVITPHVAWTPIETRRKMLSIVSENFLSFIAGNPQNVVNA